jgi:hypothetical protein
MPTTAISPDEMQHVKKITRLLRKPHEYMISYAQPGQPMMFYFIAFKLYLPRLVITQYSIAKDSAHFGYRAMATIDKIHTTSAFLGLVMLP